MYGCVNHVDTMDTKFSLDIDTKKMLLMIAKMASSSGLYLLRLIQKDVVTK